MRVRLETRQNGGEMDSEKMGVGADMTTRLPGSYVQGLVQPPAAKLGALVP